MALADKRKRRRHCSAGYAAAGHTPRQRPDGDVPQRYRTAGAVFCCGKRAHQHPPAAGRGNRGGKGQGDPVRPAAQTAAGRFSPGISAMEKRRAYRYGGGSNVQNAVVHFPLSGRDLRKYQIIVTDAVLQKGVPFCKLNTNYL